MAKSKISYECQNCGYQAPKWQGKCPSCGEWNTFTETISTGKKASPHLQKNEAQSLGDLTINETSRYETPAKELNRVLGGGLVPGSMILIGGEPGIGKSTLLLQLALAIRSRKVLYVSGEESLNQVKLRAARIGKSNEQCYLLPETSLEVILDQVDKIKPEVLILDSIQTIHSSEVESTAGSVPQIRECTAKIQHVAKKKGISTFLVGHITKDGYIAGPKLLEHMVDTVLYFEGDRHYNFRILRTTKNRFGSASELGIYEMGPKGLIEVENPSSILLANKNKELSGIAIAASMEGNRPILLELQALVSGSHFGTPQRSSIGFDNKRLNMMIAVLEKKCGLKLAAQDVFLNVAGGLKVEDPGVDLAIIMALASSYFDSAITENICFAAEVGLSGELRPVRQVESRVKEAHKLGFKTVYLASLDDEKLGSDLKTKIKVFGYENISTLMKTFFV